MFTFNTPKPFSCGFLFMRDGNDVFIPHITVKFLFSLDRPSTPPSLTHSLAYSPTHLSSVSSHQFCLFSYMHNTHNTYNTIQHIYNSHTQPTRHTQYTHTIYTAFTARTTYTTRAIYTHSIHSIYNTHKSLTRLRKRLTRLNALSLEGSVGCGAREKVPELWGGSGRV